MEEAQSAMKKMNRKSFEGRQISIDFAETREGGMLMLYGMFFLHWIFLWITFSYSVTFCGFSR